MIYTFIVRGTHKDPPSPDWSTKPGPLRERTYRRRFLGLGFDPKIQIVKDRPGPIRILEFQGWFT